MTASRVTSSTLTLASLIASKTSNASAGSPFSQQALIMDVHETALLMSTPMPANTILASASRPHFPYMFTNALTMGKSRTGMFLTAYAWTSLPCARLLSCAHADSKLVTETPFGRNPARAMAYTACVA
uniref:Uncharacterized protein n=1 Tax=Arundo donax TaxID=35708 RepID=A0A0A9HPK4_ARUDO